MTVINAELRLFHFYAQFQKFKKPYITQIEMHVNKKKIKKKNAHGFIECVSEKSICLRFILLLKINLYLYVKAVYKSLFNTFFSFF